MDPATLRASERILAVAIGGLSIYLGYRLLSDMPEHEKSTGKVILPGGISIYMSRVGPGAFFALFGAIVVALSLHYSVTYKESSGAAPSRAEADQSPLLSTQSKSYTGMGGSVPAASEEASSLRRMQVATDIRFLNQSLPGMLRTGLTKERRNDLAVLLARIKLAMLQTAWGPDWGNFGEFKDWAERGAVDPVPPDLKEAAGYYREGLGAAK
jgi:hypothetical protein